MTPITAKITLFPVRHSAHFHKNGLVKGLDQNVKDPPGIWEEQAQLPAVTVSDRNI